MIPLRSAICRAGPHNHDILSIIRGQIYPPSTVFLALADECADKGMQLLR